MATHKIQFGTLGTLVILACFLAGGFAAGLLTGSTISPEPVTVTVTAWCTHGESSIGPVTITPTTKTVTLPEPETTGCVRLP